MSAAALLRDWRESRGARVDQIDGVPLVAALAARHRVPYHDAHALVYEMAPDIRASLGPDGPATWDESGTVTRYEVWGRAYGLPVQVAAAESRKAAFRLAYAEAERAGAPVEVCSVAVPWYVDVCGVVREGSAIGGTRKTVGCVRKGRG